MLEDDADENDGGKDKKKGYAKGVVDKTFESFENTGKRVFDFGDTIFSSSIWWFSDIFESDFWTGDFAACA